MYELILTSNARQDLQCLDARIQRQVLSKLERLCENCDKYSHQVLKGPYKGNSNYLVETIELSILTINGRGQLKSPEFGIAHPSMNKSNIFLTLRGKKCIYPQPIRR